MGDFPRNATEITAQWLTDALRANGALRDGEVEALTVTPVGEQGQTGEVFTVKPTYAGDAGDAPESLIAKVAPPVQEVRQQMHGMGLYERELRFYERLGADSGIDVPRYYGGDIDLESGDFVLLLEDMGGCRNGDFWQSAIDDVRHAVDALTGMQARFWCSERIADMTWLRQHDDVAYNEQLLTAVLQGVWPVAKEKFPDRFGGYLGECAERLVERWSAMIHFEPGDVFTLSHGDFHPKQIFYPSDGHGRFAVFDWQTAASAGPGHDLARILACGLRPDDLRQHREELLQRYVDGLAAGGVQVEPDFVLQQIREGLMVTLFITIFAVATSDTSILEQQAADRGLDYRDRVFGDLGRVLEDFDALAALD